MFSPPFSVKDPSATRRRSQSQFLHLISGFRLIRQNERQVTVVPYWFFAPVA